MIYTKQASFPYPLLRSGSDDYVDAVFEMDVSLGENNENYLLTVQNVISSSFLEELLKCGDARLILVIKSQDNQFFSLEYKKECKIEIPKYKLSFSKKTVMQLMIQSTRDISFATNMDLNDFYMVCRNQIRVEAGCVLGFSDIVTFDGSLQKPFELFEKKLNPLLKSDIEVTLADESIVLQYKNEALMFTDIPNSRNLTNPYLYIGLLHALTAFLIAHGDQDNIEDGVDLNELNELDLNPLEVKLFSLMVGKGIDQIDFKTLDQVIHLISDNMLKKFAECVGGLNNHAD